MHWPTTTQWPMTLALLFAGVINLLPVAGLMGSETLQKLYGMAFDEPSLRILMRHRALLFGLLGGALWIAAFVPSWQPMLATTALISMLGFVAIALLEGGGNAAIQRVVWADVLASVVLAAALVWSRWG
jgi:hypothetical protein